jgi:hypothetical protein
VCVMMRGVWCVGCACESRADREGTVQDIRCYKSGVEIIIVRRIIRSKAREGNVRSFNEGGRG